MGRGLPQEVIGKAKQQVSLNDRFCFECKRCGDCCFRYEIVLTPHDALRLCQGFGGHDSFHPAPHVAAMLLPDPHPRSV